MLIKEMYHIDDVVSGGGHWINPLYNSREYVVDEFRIRFKYKIISDHKPKGVSEIEQKLYEYLKAERVMVGKSIKMHCEAFIASENGYLTIIFPIGAEDEEYQLERLIALAHEIGHYLDFKFNYEFNINLFDTRNDRSRKLKKELLAWTYAYDILNALGFSYWDDFMIKMKISLLTYFKPEEYEMMYQHIDVIEKLVRNQD